MTYPSIVPAMFLERPNRFVARCLVEGQPVTAHVKNTGRCRELLLPGVTVWLQYAPSPARKTDYSLIAVEKAGRVVNMDAQIPNAVFREGVEQGVIALPGLPGALTRIKGEETVGDSRLDFRLDTTEAVAYVEVKGVTLEEENVAYFPDAPTERGIKHLGELAALSRQGHPAYLALIVQMEGVSEFRPNDRTHPAFGQAMVRAAEAGVHLLCYDCRVTPDSIQARAPVPIRLPDFGR